MRHNRKKKHLGRSTSHRRAMLSNLVTALFQNGRIRTTAAKAKEGRRLAERLVTFAKRGDLNARRQTLKVIRNREVVKQLFDEIGPRFQDRSGGYTRIIKLENRLGDRAPMVVFELLGETEVAMKREAKKPPSPSEVTKKRRSVKKRKKSQKGAGTAQSKETQTAASKVKTTKKREGARKTSERKTSEKKTSEKKTSKKKSSEK
jgi:large subunit ribosomal protein L17